MTLRACWMILSGAAALLAAPGAVDAGQARPAGPPPMAATGSIELTDPAGDVQPIVYLESVGTGPEKEVKYPGFDVLRLAVASDGTAVTFTATLSAAPSRASYEVLEFYIDADNKAGTGVTLPFNARLAGLEYYGTLEACLEHPFFGTTCAGAQPQPVPHSAIVTLEKYGKEWMNKDVLLSLPASGTVKEPQKTRVVGAVVQASVPYAAMGVKSGQAIRLKVREACAGGIGGPEGFFPDIVLTLK
jgi:hypothetical protein